MPPPKSRSWFKRMFALVEPILQHSGVIYTFVIILMLLNIIVFAITAGPAWRSSSDASVAVRLALATARGSGAMINLNAALVVLVASRTLMTYLRQTPLNLFVPFDKAMPAFHSLVGNCLFVATLLHTGGHVVRYSILGLHGPGFFGPTSLAVSGGLLTIVMVAIRITSLKKVRTKMFEAFYWVHSAGFVAFFVLILLHGSHKGVLKTWIYVCGPLTIYVIDRTIRLMREKGSVLSITRQAGVIKGNDIVCLRIPRIFSYLAGQYCDIKVPLVSNTEWHPFTIASSPHETDMLFYIKVNGDWTRKLYALFKERDGEREDVSVHVRGPYGAPAQHVGQYEHVVLVSGGVGATPFASITKYAHHWILNYTQRGAAASNSVSAAFTRNQSVQGTPTVPGTPTHNASGYSTGGNRSHNASRHISRTQSTNFSRNMSRNFSRSASRNGSHPISRSASGKLEPLGTPCSPRAGVTAAGGLHPGVPVARSESGRLERFNSSGRPRSAHISRSGSGRLERFHSGHVMDRTGSAQTTDSIGHIIQEQRINQPFGPNGPPSRTESGAASPVGREGLGLMLPGAGQSSDDNGLRQYLDMEESADEDDAFMRPDDYNEELGNPELPIPDRRSQTQDTSPEAASGNKPAMFEIVNEYDSSQGLFDEDEEVVEEEMPVSGTMFSGMVNGVVEDDTFGLDPLDLEAGGLELEDQILREQQTASNAYNMMGMSFGPGAMMRHMNAVDAKKMRTSAVRTSMNLMDDALDTALWQDRLLFYLHTVTINWVLLWLMFLRVTLVAIGVTLEEFTFSQRGLGIFKSIGMNSVDLFLAVLVTIPILGVVIMEIVINQLGSFLSDNIANSFDLFVLLPLLFSCVGLHILNMAGVGSDVPHVSKLTVFVVWPTVMCFIVWRIARTIGSRVVLAPYKKSTHAQTKSLDYIWVSRTYEDDSWLIDELLPLAESNIVRLHRFITRHGPKTEPWMLEYEKIPLKTTYARPDWDDVFGGLVERSKSGTVIGVFFCGPDSMARMIQTAAMKAMAKSMENAYQRGYFTKRAGGAIGRTDSSGETNSLGTTRQPASGRNLAETGRNQSTQRLTGQNAEDPSAYGCSVRVAIRIENFN